MPEWAAWEARSALKSGYADGMRIEIDIFSGRPNPAWELDAQEADELLARLRALPPSEAAELPEGLGYRGLKLDAAAAHASGLPGKTLRLLEVAGGVVRLQEAGGALSHHADGGQALECWLLATAQGRIDEALRQMALAAAGCQATSARP